MIPPLKILQRIIMLVVIWAVSIFCLARYIHCWEIDYELQYAHRPYGPFGTTQQIDSNLSQAGVWANAAMITFVLGVMVVAWWLAQFFRKRLRPQSRGFDVIRK